MKRIVQLNLRITTVIDEKIDDYCKKLNLTRSKLVFNALIFYLKSKGYKKLENSINITIQRENIRERNYQLYLIKNTFMTIINMSKMDLLFHTEINMNKVNSIIKECKRLYNLYPPKIKKLLKADIKQLENLRFKNNIMQFMNNWDLVQEFLGMKKNSAKRIEMK